MEDSNASADTDIAHDLLLCQRAWLTQIYIVDDRNVVILY